MQEPHAESRTTQEQRAGRPAPGARPRTYKTEALVLRSFDEGEADRVVILLTPGLGDPGTGGEIFLPMC